MVIPMMTYMDKATAREILEAASDSAQALADEARGAREVFRGLLAGPLADEPESALIALRLFAGLRSSAEHEVKQAVVDLYYSDKATRPAVNEIARSAGVSVTTVKAWAERAENIESLPI